MNELWDIVTNPRRVEVSSWSLLDSEGEQIQSGSINRLLAYVLSGATGEPMSGDLKEAGAHSLCVVVSTRGAVFQMRLSLGPEGIWLLTTKELEYEGPVPGSSAWLDLQRLKQQDLID